MILLDSNTIVYLSKEIIRIDDIFYDNEEYGISVITYMEVLGYDFESRKKIDFDFYNAHDIYSVNKNHIEKLRKIDRKEKTSREEMYIKSNLKKE